MIKKSKTFFFAKKKIAKSMSSHPGLQLRKYKTIEK